MSAIPLRKPQTTTSRHRSEAFAECKNKLLFQLKVFLSVAEPLLWPTPGSPRVQFSPGCLNSQKKGTPEATAVSRNIHNTEWMWQAPGNLDVVKKFNARKCGQENASLGCWNEEIEISITWTSSSPLFGTLMFAIFTSFKPVSGITSGVRFFPSTVSSPSERKPC